MKDIQRKLIKRKMKLSTLAETNGVEFNKVLEIYTKYSARVYQQEKFKGFYNEKIENHIYDLTERWVKIHGSS